MNTSLLVNRSHRISEVHQRLSAILFPIEQLRIDVRKRKRVFYQTLFLSISVCVILLVLIPMLLMYIWIFIIGLIVALGAFYYYYVNKEYTKLVFEFNHQVIPIIVEEFFPESTFSSNDHISMPEYWASKLFKSRVDRYNGDQLFYGTFGQTDIRFSNLHTEYKTQTRNKNGSTTTRWHTIFKGVFMIADSNKTFKGETFIFPDTAERFLGGVGKWFQEKLGSTGRGEMVYMENPLFEKKFVVYSSDPVEARYLITPSMQQYFLDLLTHMGNQSVHVSFIRDRIYLGLSGSFNLFNIKLNKSFNDVATIEYYSKDLLQILSVIEILDLNTRIWGK